MRIELEDALVRDFPNLYGDSGPSYGFECGDGWEPAIRRLSERLEGILNGMTDAERFEFRVEQVKEKFGGLRFYVHPENEEMSSAIRAAERECARACEECGSQGELLTRNGWAKTTCEACRLGRFAAR